MVNIHFASQFCIIADSFQPINERVMLLIVIITKPPRLANLAVNGRERALGWGSPCPNGTTGMTPPETIRLNRNAADGFYLDFGCFCAPMLIGAAMLANCLFVGCGGFTTFSTFSAETLLMIESGDTLLGVAYAAASCVLCVAAAFLGEIASSALAVS